MAPGKPRVQFRVMEGAETLGLRALRREFGLYGEARRRTWILWAAFPKPDISSYISSYIWSPHLLIPPRCCHPLVVGVTRLLRKCGTYVAVIVSTCCRSSTEVVQGLSIPVVRLLVLFSFSVLFYSILFSILYCSFVLSPSLSLSSFFSLSSFSLLSPLSLFSLFPVFTCLHFSASFFSFSPLFLAFVKLEVGLLLRTGHEFLEIILRRISFVLVAPAVVRAS